MRPDKRIDLSTPVRLKDSGPDIAIPANDCARVRQSAKFGYGTPLRSPSRVLSANNTNLSGPAYGNGRSSSAFTTLKMAVLAPTPKASVTTAIKVKPGFLANMRAP